MKCNTWQQKKKKEERNGNTDVCMNQSYDRQGHKERVLLKPNQQTGISGSPENTGLNKSVTLPVGVLTKI